MKVLAIFCLVVATVVATPTTLVGSTLFEILLDVLIKEANVVMKVAGMETLPLPDLSDSIAVKLLSLEVDAAFSATNGTVGKVYTLKRTGDAKLTRYSDYALLEVCAGLDTMEFTYDNYTLDVSGIELTGTVNGKVGTNSFNTTLRMDFPEDDSCVTTIQSVDVLELDNFQVAMTGLGIMDGISDDVTNYFMTEYPTQIANALAGPISEALNSILTEYDICEKFRI